MNKVPNINGNCCYIIALGIFLLFYFFIQHYHQYFDAYVFDFRILWLSHFVYYRLGVTLKTVKHKSKIEPPIFQKPSRYQLAFEVHLIRKKNISLNFVLSIFFGKE